MSVYRTIGSLVIVNDANAVLFKHSYIYKLKKKTIRMQYSLFHQPAHSPQRGGYNKAISPAREESSRMLGVLAGDFSR